MPSICHVHFSARLRNKLLEEKSGLHATVCNGKADLEGSFDGNSIQGNVFGKNPNRGNNLVEFKRI